MARIIHIPMSFEFRIKRVKWVEAEGRITGVSVAHTLRREFYKSYNCNVPVDPGKDLSGAPKLQATVLLDNETRYKDVAWPNMPYKRGELHARFERFVMSHDLDTAAEQIFSDYRPHFFFAEEDEDPLDKDEDYFRSGTPADAWRLREAFLKLAPDSPNILAFLNEWGYWDSGTCIQPQEILNFQQWIRHALLSRPSEWLSRQESLTLLSPPPDSFWDSESPLHPSGARSGYPNFEIRTYLCHTAISATVTLDLLRRVPFRSCARPDCRHPFEITSRHVRKYCTQYCAHLESVRRTRKLIQSRAKDGMRERRIRRR